MSYNIIFVYGNILDNVSISIFIRYVAKLSLCFSNFICLLKQIFFTNKNFPINKSENILRC